MDEDARVDKAWQKKGLAGYSTGAILGTLGHYGTPTDEQRFRALAAERYPLSIAESWLSGWRGTGQFARFPLAAADELWRRLQPDRLSPADLAETLGNLAKALQEVLQGSPSAPVGAALAQAQARVKALPKDGGGKVAAPFVEELEWRLGPDGVSALGELAQTLAQEGHVDDADDLVALYAAVFSARGEVTQARVRGAKGDREGAIQDLDRVLGRKVEDPSAAMEAVDALLALDAHGQARGHIERLLEEAERAQDPHFALALAERLGGLLERSQDRAALSQLDQRVERLQKAHAAAHPHH